MKNRKKYITAAVVILTLTAIIFSIMYLQKNNRHMKACFKEKCFTLEVAETPEERAKGLMYREKLGEDRGMIFIFEEEDIYPFWMKNTKIPLDIIWINSDKEIVYINRNTPPCTEDPCPKYYPQHPAKYVIELKAGTADKLQMIAGDRIEF